MPSALWKWWLATGSVIIALYVALPGSGTWDLAYLATGLSVPVAIVLGVRHFRPTARAPWLWVAFGQSLLFIADVIWLTLERMGLEPFPSIADVAFLSAYPCVAIGLALLVRHRTAKRELSSLLDAAIVAIGAGIVTWVLVIGPMLADVESTALERIVSVAYPLLDLLVLAVVARLAFGGGIRTPAFVMLTLGLLINLGVDVRYLFEELSGTYVEFGWLDGGWMTAYLLIGASALHPTMALLSRPEGVGNEQLTPARLAVLTTASITAPAVLLLQWLRGGALEIPVITTGSIAMFVLVVVRLSELGRLVAQTRARGEARFRSLVHNATDVIVVLDADGVITYASPAVQRVWHHRSAEVIGVAFSELVHPNDADRFAASFALARDSGTGEATTFEGRIWSPSQRWRSFEAITANLLDDPSVNGVVLTCRDTTERVMLEEQLTYQAFHDPLTGLANRALFLDRVEHALERISRLQGRMIAVLFIDLDDFKTVNDGLGHSTGDTLLREVGQRLTSILRPGDTAARLGGDEFAVLIEEASDRSVVTAVAERLIATIEAPFHVGDVVVSVRASIGVAARDTTDSAELLIRDADIAMYDAKTGGKGTYAWFDTPMRTQAVDRWKLQTDLANALHRDELFLHYQPIFDLSDGRIVGAEALLRWQHPTRGTISPGEFIPIAEQTGLIDEIGAWALRQATEEAGRWPGQDGPAWRYISVNVSAVQLRDRQLVGRVAETLARSSLPPHALVIELTESTLMEDIAWTRTLLHDLRDLGVAIAVDDFGTGYSSLAYLRQFPVDLLKIDRGFISDLQTQSGAETLTRDIITLARTLQIASVAEGIENRDQLELLRSMGCGMGQGFHLGRPMPAGDLRARLDREITTAVSR